MAVDPGLRRIPGVGIVYRKCGATQLLLNLFNRFDLSLLSIGSSFSLVPGNSRYLPRTRTTKLSGRMACRGCGLFRGRGGWRPEFRGHHENLVSLLVEGEGAGAFLRLNIFGDAEFAGRFFAHHRQHALAAGREGEAGAFVKGGGIHSFADCGRGKHFAAVGVDHGHHLIVAAGKQAAILAVDGEAAGFLARGQRPARFHFQLCWDRSRPVGSCLQC